jgi:N-acetylmuramoyl-L-alanine amidase
MRSFASPLTAPLLLAMLATGDVCAQGPAEAYTDMLRRESILRAELERAETDAPLPDTAITAILRRVRVTVAAYDEIARRHPTSGYSDNALWQGAMLSADAFWQFGEAADRQTARRLFEALRSRFPSSSLIRGIPDQLTRLERARPTPPRPATTVAGARAADVRTVAASSASDPSQAYPSTLEDIRREVLPDVLRVTLVLAHERPYVSQRLEDPSRLYIDLQHTRTLYSLKDSDLTFDGDVVRRIRVGSHEGERTRVVLDLDGAGPTSVYPLYHPYRLVIDVGRTRPAASPEVVLAATARTPARTDPAPPAAAPPAPAAANSDGSFSLSRQLGLGAARIVIDAGHGGHDPGAKVSGLTEAALVLDVALRLEALLREHPGVDVVLTRRTDAFLALEERTAIANREQADLFLSIHANASTNPNARGIETYFLNFAGNAEAEAIAARENAGSSRTMRNLPEIVRAIALNDKINESRDFATEVQKTLYDGLRPVNTGTKNLGVKQAPFQVLIGATMPSILAEISFITHTEEGRLLRTDVYRQEIAKALFNGIVAYRGMLTH